MEGGLKVRGIPNQTLGNPWMIHEPREESLQYGPPDLKPSIKSIAIALFLALPLLNTLVLVYQPSRLTLTQQAQQLGPLNSMGLK